LINFLTKLDQYDEIIRNYDEVIQTKASKMLIEEFKNHAENSYATQDSIDDNIANLNSKADDLQEDMKLYK
jgi:hypothetical protein